MKRLIWGSVVALLLMSEPAAATCLYQGVPYSEGARVCMYRTMFMCRGERWIKTAERCWERYSKVTPLLVLPDKNRWPELARSVLQKGH